MSARIYAAAVICLGALLAPPALTAREMTSPDAMVGHSGFAPPGRSFIGPRARPGGRPLVDHRHFGRSGHSPQFGSVGLFGLAGETVDFARPPIPAVVAGEPQSAPAQPADRLPPCRETMSAGIVIARGMACSHAAR